MGFVETSLMRQLGKLVEIVRHTDEVLLDFDYASPNGKNIIMRISYFDALS